MSNENKWTDEIFNILREWDVIQFSHVPDAGHKALIQKTIEDPNVHSIPLSTEEEGVAMLVGAHLGLKRGVVLMQSSGVGNCINTFQYVRNEKYPMLILVSMRGDFGERIPWQFGMGQIVRPIFETCGFICMKIEKREDVSSKLQAACNMVFRGRQAVAVLLSQRLLGAKMI